MNLIDERIVYGIGNGTARIYTKGAVAADGAYEDGVGYVIEVENGHGLTSVEVDQHDAAFATFLHPFARGLTIPAPKAEAGHMENYHAMYAAIELAEAGDGDAV
jgi:hypothetical protein